jgi:hypothetical protein
MSNDTLDDLFAGGGAPAVKWETLGQKVVGPITKAEARQARDFETGDLLTWDDGRPKMEVILTIATGQIDPGIEGDDGERRVFVRGHMFTALREALNKAKARKPEPGGRVAIVWSGEGEPPKKGFKAPRLFTVAYEPPAIAAVEDLFAQAPATPAPASDEAADLAALLAKS